jgi:endogenous inhibitor of DNA gyrase (YacG/DUF329 family)
MKCPTCKVHVEWKDNPYRPFCSERCQLIDLGCWVNGEYSVPGDQTQIPDEVDSSVAPSTASDEEQL